MNRAPACVLGAEPLTIVTPMNALPDTTADHQISVVIPVYGGEGHLSEVVGELAQHACDRTHRPATPIGSPRCCSSTTAGLTTLPG